MKSKLKEGAVLNKSKKVSALFGIFRKDICLFWWKKTIKIVPQKFQKSELLKTGLKFHTSGCEVRHPVWKKHIKEKKIILGSFLSEAICLSSNCLWLMMLAPDLADKAGVNLSYNTAQHCTLYYILYTTLHTVLHIVHYTAHCTAYCTLHCIAHNSHCSLCTV